MYSIDFESGAIDRISRLEGSHDTVAVSDDGEWAAAGGDEGVLVWSVPSGRRVDIPASPVVTALAFTPAGWIVVGNREGALSAWSATPGMALCGITLRRFDGARLDGGTAFLHTLGYHLSWLIFPLQLISVAFMAISSRGQGLSDLALGTVAIRRPAD